MTRLHLDTDLGGDIDDLCALAMILKWENFEIKGITTVAEDNGKRAGYTRYTLQLAEKWEKTYTGLPDDILKFQHACAVALGWDGVIISELPIKVEVRDGWLHQYVAETGKPTRIVTEFDGDRFNEIW